MRAGARSSLNASLKDDFSWQFTTFIIPVVTCHIPTGLDEPVDTNITISFNVSMNRTSVNNSLSFSPSFSWISSWSPDNKTVTIDPVSNLTENTTYDITVHAGARSAVNASLKDDFVWQFKTFIIPVVTSHTPTGLDEPLDTNITVSFNVPMNRTSVNDSLSFSPSFSWTASWSPDNRTITIIPNRDLNENTTYTVTVHAGTLSTVNASLEDDFTYDFRTYIVPYITKSAPWGSDIPLNSSITVSFNVPMNNSSVQGLIRIVPSFSHTCHWSLDFKNLSLTNISFSENLEYNITFQAGALALTGAEMPADYSWTFRTLLLPKVIEFSPTGDNVSLTGTEVIIRFNKPMNRNSTEPAISIDQTAKLAFPRWMNDTVLVFNATFYKPRTVYTVTIGTAAHDLTGVHLPATQSFAFMTGEAPISPADAPKITFYAPKGSGTSSNPTITISFDREMDIDSVNGSISISPKISIASCVRFNTTYNFSLASSLLPNVTYTVQIDITARSLAGVFLASPFCWNFTTIPAGQQDNDLPVVLYTDPSNGDRNIGASKVITIVFSEGMDKNSTELAVSIYPPVEGTWSWLQGGGVFLQFRSKGNLAIDMYRIVVNSSRALDESGNPLDGNGNGRADGRADDYIFEFTVGIIHPNLLSKSPEGKGVGLGEPIRMTFDRDMNLSSIRDSFSIQPSINGIWTIDADGKNITFTPDKRYRPGMRYTITFSQPLRDRNNNSVELGSQWAFTTVSPTTQGGTEPLWWLLALAILLAVGVAVGVAYSRKRSKAPSKIDEENAGVSAEEIPMATLLPQVPPVPVAAGECAIENVFLIYKDGRLIQHTTRSIQADMDVEIVTSMLTAVQAFVKDSFGKEDGAELGSMEYGGKKILMEKGKNTILAVEICGNEPAGLRDEMKHSVNDIESEFGPVLDGWDGAPVALSGAKRFMTRLGAFQPADIHAPEKPKENVSLKAELEFYQGFIRLKVAVKNDSPTLIADATLLLVYSKDAFRLDHIEPQYPYEDGLQFGVVKPREKKTAAFYLDPQICTESYIEGILTYKDASDNLETVKMKKLRAAVVCPIIFTVENINTAMLRRMAVEELEQKDTKVFMIPAGTEPQKAFDISKAAVQHHDVRLVREYAENDPFVGEAWYYGKAKGRDDRLVIRTRVIAQKNVLEFYVASSSTLMLTGMLAELKSDLNKERDAQKVRAQMKQVTEPEEVDAIAAIQTLLDKASEAETGAGDTETAQ